MQALSASNNCPASDASRKSASDAENSDSASQTSEKRHGHTYASDRARHHDHDEKNKHHSHHHNKKHLKDDDNDKHRHHHGHKHRSRSRSAEARRHDSHNKDSKKVSESRGQRKVDPANDVPFANPPLPNRVVKNVFAEETSAVAFVTDNDNFHSVEAEKPESKASIQILIGPSITALDQKQPETFPAAHPIEESIQNPSAAIPKEGPETAAHRERLNSQEEIGKRQSYFKMVELERDQCEAQHVKDPTVKGAEGSSANAATDGKKAAASNSKVPHAACDNAAGYLKVRPGDIIGKYKVNSIAGKGVFGSVLRCTDTSNQTEAALKVIRSKDVYSASGEKELKVLIALNQGDPYDRKNIIRVLSTFYHQNHLCIAMEPFDTNLREAFTRVTKFSSYSLSTLQSYTQQLLKALYYLKKKRIVHADMKPDNVLVSRDSKRVKICDFGTALYIDEVGVTEYVASRYYRAPEIILGCPFDTQIDMWGLGTTLFEAYTGKILFPGISNNDMIRLMLKMKCKPNVGMLKKGKFSSKHFDEKGTFVQQKEVSGKYVVEDLMSALRNANPQADVRNIVFFKDFLQKTLAFDPAERITPEEALGHPFVGLRAKSKLF